MTFYIFYEPLFKATVAITFSLQFPMILLEKTHSTQKFNKYKMLS